VSKTTILVTGATGYIGSALIGELLGKYDRHKIHIKALVRKTSNLAVLDAFPVEFIEGDLNDVHSLQKATQEVDVIFHTAALVSYQRHDRRKLFRINVQGTRNIVNASLMSGVKRLIFTSSVAALGVDGSGNPSDETVGFKPWQHRIGYMDSKYLSELEIYRGIAEGLDAVIVNPAVVIGKYPRIDIESKSSTRLIREIYRGNIPYYPTGGVGFVDVGDVARAHVIAWEKGVSGEKYCIVSENLSYKSFFDLIQSFSGSRKNEVFPLSKTFGQVLGFFLELYGLVFQRTTPIALDNVYLSNQMLFYSNKKSIEQLNLNYTSIKTSLKGLIEV
jgi:dihydroflavonol-4-reductase